MPDGIERIIDRFEPFIVHCNMCGPIHRTTFGGMGYAPCSGCGAEMAIHVTIGCSKPDGACLLSDRIADRQPRRLPVNAK